MGIFVEQSNLDQFQKEIDSLIQKFGGYWPPLSMLASIVEEVGELAREINAIENFKPKRNNTIKNSENKIGEELADIIFSVICLSNYYNLNMDTYLENTIDKYKKRDKDRFGS